VSFISFKALIETFYFVIRDFVIKASNTKLTKKQKDLFSAFTQFIGLPFIVAHFHLVEN